ncbi:hypothetical protein GCM10009557_77580 [Virgisporangium ochraceum]|uniref:Uncharacterized protein n=1 Tax=Virgisporangium ochraceum TaxID=65505 RepID=A0A8J4A3Y1_9ACTN|nr:hypothetical protein Voc01_102940 [Virgisporangium ochraceum]
MAASGVWIDDSGQRQPGGEAHAWFPGQNQTACGRPLNRARLYGLAHVPFDYRRTDHLDAADRIGWICPRCVAATTPRPRRTRTFHRP